MTISAISVYQGGSPEAIAPLAGALKSAYSKYGIGYRLGQFDSGPNKGNWCALVTYADETAYAQAQASFANDTRLQGIFDEISKVSKRISREMVRDLDL